MFADSIRLDDSATAIHEMFLSFLRAGFSRKEALSLVKLLVALDYEGTLMNEEQEEEDGG